MMVSEWLDRPVTLASGSAFVAKRIARSHAAYFSYLQERGMLEERTTSVPHDFHNSDNGIKL
jgi:hypothetical protein